MLAQETAPLVSPQAESPPQPEVFSDALTEERKATLRLLLPEADCEYVIDEYAADPANSKLLGRFYYDEATGRDALVHILGGEIKVSKDGAMVPKGFHHRASGEALWGHERKADGEVVPLTRVDQVVNAEGAPAERQRMEPYVAHVAVNGQVKTMLRKTSKPRRTVIETGKSSMFPDEYDALTVMKAISIAYDNTDATKDKLQQVPGFAPLIMKEGTVPMIDGKTPMTIRMFIDQASQKIVAAMPLLKGQQSMNLSENDMWHYLTYGHVAKDGE